MKILPSTMSAGLPSIAPEHVPRRRDDGGRIKPLYAALLVGAAYYAGAVLGMALTFQPLPVSTLWFPNAILLAAFLLTSPRRWWLLVVAAFVAHLAAELQVGVPIVMALCWFVSNCTEALIGAVLIRRLAAWPLRLDRFGNVMVFVVAALTAAFLSSFLDAAFVQLNDWGSSGFWSVWRSRFFANSLASLTVVPVILGLSSVRAASLQDATPARYVEGTLLAVGLLTVTIGAFGRQAAGPDTTPALLYVPLPFLLWAVVRFGPAASSTAVFAAVLISTWNAVHGRGPFASQSAEANALEIQFLFGIVAVALMSLAAVMEELRRAQSKARREGEQLQLTLDAAQITTWDWVVPPEMAATTSSTVDDIRVPPADDDGRPAVGNDRVQTVDDDRMLILDSALGRIHPADRPAVSAAFVGSVSYGTPLDIQFRMAQPAGDVRWIHARGKVLRDGDGRPVRVVGVSADITERRMAEALNTGESRILEMIATGAPLKQILTSIVQLIETESLGLTCSVLVIDDDGSHVRHVAAPNLPEQYVRAIDGLEIGPAAGSCGTAIYLRRPVLSVDIRNDPLWKDHRETALRYGLRGCWSTPIFSNHGDAIGSFAVYYRYPRRPSLRERQLVDLATQLAAIALERKRAEVEVAAQRRALAHLGRVAVLGELSGALAHELSQPLTAILSDAQAARRLLAASPQDDLRVREILDAIVAADRRAAEVIDRLRTLLKKRVPHFVRLELNAVVAETLNLLRSDLTAREVMVTTRLTPGLPAVYGDSVQLQQVLLNLCLNAGDAMSENSPDNRAMTFTTRCSPDRAFVELALTDYGAGIPTDDVARVFEPFFTTKEHGLGLGLAICRSIVVEHGGTLSAMNNPGGGATFKLTLPAAESARAVHARSATPNTLIGTADDRR